MFEIHSSEAENESAEVESAILDKNAEGTNDCHDMQFFSLLYLFRVDLGLEALPGGSGAADRIGEFFLVRAIPT